MSVTVKINQIQYGRYTPRLKLHKKAFYKVYSPKAFKLRPMESITIDLKLNIIWAECLTPTELDLYPTLKQFGLSLEESNWKNVCQTGIKYFLLPYTNKRIITDYEYNESFD